MVEKSMVVCLGSVRCGSRLSCGFGLWQGKFNSSGCSFHVKFSATDLSTGISSSIFHLCFCDSHTY
jgi:hypothetical protein